MDDMAMETFNPEREGMFLKSTRIMSLIRLADIFAVFLVLPDWSGGFPKGSLIPVLAPFLLECAWLTDVIIPDDARPSWLHGSGVLLPGSWRLRCWLSVALHVIMTMCALVVGLPPSGPIPAVMVSAAILTFVTVAMIMVIVKGPAAHMKGHGK